MVFSSEWMFWAPLSSKLAPRLVTAGTCLRSRQSHLRTSETGLLHMGHAELEQASVGIHESLRFIGEQQPCSSACMRFKRMVSPNKYSGFRVDGTDLKMS